MSTTSDNSYAFVEGGWSAYTGESARRYYAHLGKQVNPRRATPFLNDGVSRALFETVTLDGVKEE